MKGDMSMFNLKKSAEKSKVPSNNELMLEEQRKKMGTDAVSKGEITNVFLDDTRKNENDVPTIEKKLSANRKATATKTTEGQIEDSSPPDGLPKREGKDKFDQLPINLLAEANDKEKAKAFNAASTKDANTALWDSYIGDQMDGKKTKSVSNSQPSQLQNHVDRFDGLTKDNVMGNKGVKEMVMASLMDADAMLYYIYHTASKENRTLTAQEAALVNNINSDKSKMLNRTNPQQNPNRKAYMEGYQAASENPSTHNPYPTGTELHEAWQNGFNRPYREQNPEAP